MDVMDMDRFRALAPERRNQVRGWAVDNGFADAIKVEWVDTGVFLVTELAGVDPSTLDVATSISVCYSETPPPWVAWSDDPPS